LLRTILTEEVTMTRHSVGIAGIALILASALIGRAHVVVSAQAPTSTAAAAAKASPELVGALSKEIGGTPEQAAGAAGALFGVAKSRLKPDDFSKIASAVPGMDSLLGAAPAMGAAAATGGAVGTSGTLSQVAGTATGLASATSAFQKLGLKPEMVSKAVPILTSFVTKSGGADVGTMLASVLK
jgi:Protein of unknown function VcgC/VcgE (DUF2780)